MGKNANKRVLLNIFAHAVNIKSLLLVLGFIFSTSWMTSIFYDVVKDIVGANNTYAILLLLSIGILTILYFYFQKLLKDFADDNKIDINSEKERPRKVLILFLSNISDILYEAIPQKMDADNIEKWLNDVAKINRGHNPWKMPYLSIDRHKSTLEKIYILTSPESRKQYEQFKKIIEKSHKRTFLISQKHVVDINDIDRYNSIFNTIYDENRNYKEEDIVIDATSGIKLYSIAGSYFALSSNKIIQYVDTSDYKVRQFNNKILPND